MRGFAWHSRRRIAVLGGAALTRYDTRSVLTVALLLKTVSIVAIVTTALVERSALRAATIDSSA